MGKKIESADLLANSIGARQEMRRQAEKLAMEKPFLEEMEKMSLAEVRQMVHELRVHEIELEMQNEELRAAQEALDASMERYFNLYDLAPVGYITLSNKGIILEANLTAATLLGKVRRELVRGSMEGFILGEDQDSYYLHSKKLFESGDPQECELRMVKKDGVPFWAHLTSTLANHDGAPVRRIVIINITQRKQAEQDYQQSQAERKKLQVQLNQAQKMEAIGTLAGGIAHDFNNILFSIVGHVEMLMEDLAGENSSIRNSLNEIYTGALRSRDLVQQILAFARQEKNELKLMKMQPIIKEALKLIRSTIPTTISIKQNLNPECGPVKADPTQIHQIVMNLATNAYHAMENNGGELKVNLKEMELGEYDLITPDMLPGLYACLTIADTGVGMSRDVMNRIFDPFFTTKEKGKGTGMGLSVVYGIVKGMDGEIEVYSEPGMGSEFNVYIPVVGNIFEKQEQKVNEPILGGCERVLLVDDEDVIIIMEKLILERLGYQVFSHTSSIEALELFRADPDKFDLVITDMAMPKMAGDKLAGELIRIRPDIPILLCTGFSDSLIDEKIKFLGIKGLLMKPIIIKDFAEKIRKVLDK